MISRATERFWKLYHQLPGAVQELAVKNYGLYLDGEGVSGEDAKNGDRDGRASQSAIHDPQFL